MNQHVKVIDNPAAKHLLSILRDKNTSPIVFRETMEKIGVILAYEASRKIQWTTKEIETPLSKTIGVYPSGKTMVVGILGASLPLVYGFIKLIPWAEIGLIAARRLETRKGVETIVYYERLPVNLEKYAGIFLVDPMLATGKTIEVALRHLRRRGAGKIIILTVIASKPGLKYIMDNAENVEVITLSIDPVLNENYMIVPGLGDAGDRALSVNLVF